MHWDVVSAKVINHLEFVVTFADGISSGVRMFPSHLFGHNASVVWISSPNPQNSEDSGGENYSPYGGIRIASAGILSAPDNTQ